MATPHRRPPTPKGGRNPVRYSYDACPPRPSNRYSGASPSAGVPRSGGLETPSRPLSADKKHPSRPQVVDVKQVQQSPRVDRGVLTPSNAQNITPQVREKAVVSSVERHRVVQSHSARELGRNNDLDKTLNPAKIVSGERVKVISSEREGVAMYVGTAKFAPGKTVVGIKLDQKRSSSLCDGKYRSERHFWCPPGFGVYCLLEEVEKSANGREDVKAPNPSELPPKEELQLEKELSDLVGLDAVKQHVKSVRNWVTVQRRRESVGVNVCKPLHFVFAGNKGTGMTTVGKLLAHMLRDLEVVENGQYIEVSPKDITTASHSGDAEKKVNEWFDRAKGGILAIEDAHLFKADSGSRSREQAGMEALAAFAKRLEGNPADSKRGVWPQPVVVLLSGPRAELNALLHAQPTLERYCTNNVEFKDFSVDELVGLVRKCSSKRKFTIDRGVTDAKLTVYMRRAQLKSGAEIKNIRQVASLLDDVISRQTDRVFDEGIMSKEGLTKLTEKDFVGVGEKDASGQGSADPALEALKQLDNTVGLDEVKQFVHQLHAQLRTQQQRHEAGLGGAGHGSLHMLFVGNPGTGKTTVARVVADLLNKMGMLRNGHLVEADRASLVAGYCGQTALKTKAVVESAIGGVLFIDEAYALVQGERDSFGTEALDTLIRLVEEHRNELVCVMAGYRDEMAQLVSRNPGLQSRFPTTIEFPDYTVEQLMQIGERMLLQDCMMLNMDASSKLNRMLKKLIAMSGSRSSATGNGRAVRNLLEKAKRRQALRLQRQPGKKEKDDLCQLIAADFDEKDLEVLVSQIPDSMGRGNNAGQRQLEAMTPR
jgi:SpoVK/Ycf46/Vps4 family AAA+-type ATPase